MQFENAIITKTGLKLLAQAAGNKRLIFTKLEFTGSPDVLSDESTSLSAPTWGHGSCDSAEWNGYNYVIYVSASNEFDYGVANGFGVFGHLEGESVDRLIFVANALGTPCTIQPTSGMHTRFHFAITLKYQVEEGSIIVDGQYAGLVSEEQFDKWKNRVVTTHIEASDTIGENQDVYGIKNFRNGINVTNGAGDTNPATIYKQGNALRTTQREGRKVAYVELTASARNADGRILTNCNVEPIADAKLSIGSPNYRWFGYFVGAPIGTLAQQSDMSKFENPYTGYITQKSRFGVINGMFLGGYGVQQEDQLKYILCTNQPLDLMTRYKYTEAKYSANYMNIDGTPYEKTVYIRPNDITTTDNAKRYYFDLFNALHPNNQIPADQYNGTYFYKLNDISVGLNTSPGSITHDQIVMHTLEVY